ncbi:unnamed protein product [Brassicogethes aeneus]|uniref:RNA helicase n=1 Tax=Brassicogethes aeneus TaxID=1431903 RepID=A0A9P0FMX6_BRAAE|nr:unnamed protein product [Brassicogethes aeneus]
MSLRIFFRNNLRKPIECRLYSAEPQVKPEKPRCIISSHRTKLNHYTNTEYLKFTEIPLISKGWNHSKSKNDSFTIHPVDVDEHREEMHDLEEMGLNEDLRKVLRTWNVEKATDLQYRSFPAVLNGKHTLIAAETGCGKTLAYLLPIIKSLIGQKQNNLNHPQVVVLVPNRELAYQVGEIATNLSDAVGLKTKVLVGGRTKKLMMNPEFEDIDILVATPGAIGKLSTVGVYKLSEVRFMVLDEADTLVDDSFVERISSLVKRVPQAQFILCSATLPKKLPDVLAPIEMGIQHVTSSRLHKPPMNITQKFLKMTRSAKPSHLLQVVKNCNEPKLIFTNRNETCNWVAMFLRENNIPCSNINGEMNYAIRIDQWNQFVAGKNKILAATDVGSRGLNTIQVKHVINYNFPLYAADYLHRIGRVGRTGSPDSCRVTNFISGPEEVQLVRQIEYAIRKNEPLQNVDGNITNMVQKKILKSFKEAS